MKSPNPYPVSILVIVFIVAFAATAIAAPMYGEPWKLKQDDGTMVDVLIWGDEYYQHVESPDGYTLVRDPVTSAICYARLSDDGAELISTGAKVGSVHPSTLGLQPHLRINKESAYRKQKEMRDLAGVSMPGEMRVTAAPPPSTGNVLGLVLIVDFDDNQATIARDDVDDFCNMDGYNGNGNNGSIQDYFDEVSDGLLNYTSWVMPAYHRASEDFSYYDDCTEPWLDRAKELIIEVLDQLEADGHDFSVYDSNNDGYIDALNLFYAGNTGCGWSKGMWPGSGGMKDAWSADGVATNRYQITGMGGSLTQGTYLHENGHMVCGWPDLYDYDTGADDSKGAGVWCLMANQYTFNTQEPCGYLKTTAGWSTPIVINADQLGIALGPNSNNANLYKFPNPGNAKEYFLIENRGNHFRDSNLPDSGLEILHIDEDGNNSNNEMTPGSHYLVTIVQADGLWDLENDVNSGDADDLYSAPDYTACTPCTNPDTDWWDGTASDYNFTTTSASAANMTFDFTIGDGMPTAAVKSYGADGDTDCCILVSVSDIDNGSSDPNGEGDIESLLITAVDGNPVTPAETVEVCGDGMHTVTLTITDKCGNSDSADASVEVENEAPVALCKSFAAEADEDCCIIVNLSDIDNGSYDPDGASDLETFGITHIDGNYVGVQDQVEVCGNGMHAVTITMVDWCGQVSSCDADVEVIDVTPPEITVTLDRDALWPPNHKLVPIMATVEVTDNCDPDPDWYLESITSNEPDNGRGDGSTTGDIQAAIGTQDVDFELRAERMGTGNGRKYTVIYYAEDESGNVARDTACVEVPHDQGHPSMMAADGFSSDGTAFTHNTQTFTVVIGSTGDLDATKVDPYRTFVGNTAVAIRPVSSRIVDANDDGLNDLAVLYSIQQAEEIPTGHWLSRLDGLAEAAEYGYLGLHFWAPDGSGRLVMDILSLGEPITIGSGADRKYEPKQDIVMAPEVPQQKQFEDGISSIYPNPFNPATTIKFSLAESRGVKVAIYDVNGALVRVLVDQSMAAGEHTVPWNGTDTQGRSVASGVYFARMVAGDFAMTRKMVLMK